MPAKLPSQLLKAKTRLVKNTEIGERFTVFSSTMRVAEDGSCYLSGDAHVTGDGLSLPPLTVIVERRQDGFHVVATPKHAWEVSEDLKVEDMLPVASVTIAENA